MSLTENPIVGIEPVEPKARWFQPLCEQVRLLLMQQRQKKGRRLLTGVLRPSGGAVYSRTRTEHGVSTTGTASFPSLARIPQSRI